MASGTPIVRITLDSPSLGSPESLLKSETLSESFDLLIASKTFSRSEQLKRLLVYLRDVSETSDPAAWSETAIGSHVFGRQDFNPKLDTIVRVEMRRLRQKLDEFYAAEGAGLSVRLRFEKNSYKPYLKANAPDTMEITPDLPASGLAATKHPAMEVHPPEAVRAKTADRFWFGCALGAGCVVLLVLVAFLIWRPVAGASSAADSREAAQSPLWRGFRRRNVEVALGSPLFFRSGDGFERDFRMNLPSDLSAADRFLLRRPSTPQWNYWAPFDDVGAAVKLDRFLRDVGSTATIVSARLLSIGALAGKRTIVVGQPRTAPFLADLLRDQNFRPPEHASGENFSGILNTNPRPGEPNSSYFGHRSEPLPYGMIESDESNPDHALVTSIHLANGGEVLSVFGDRSPTEAYLITRLADPVFISELDSRVFGRSDTTYESAQIFLRVDYNRGSPTGLVYVSHRIRFPAANHPTVK